MEIFTSYYTNKGNVKKINQDSFSVKVVNSPRGKIAFAIICDGMGGLEQGELASKEVVVAFHNWFATKFAQMVADNNFSPDLLKEQWQDIIDSMNIKLSGYASQQGMMMGTTVSAILLYQEQYFLCHVGDSRIYMLTDVIKQLTRDQTLVAQEVQQGILTKEEAKEDPRRSVLLQCVGASEVIVPQYEMGKLEQNTTFILCSDGFTHLVTEEELYEAYQPEGIWNKEQGNEICKNMVQLVMDRKERDNVTVVAIIVK